MPDGNGSSDSSAASIAAGSDGAIGNMMPGDGAASPVPEDRGMPGLAQRAPSGDMPSGGMGAKQGARDLDMPAGRMGNGSIGLERAGGGGGSGGGSGGGGGGSGDGSGQP